MYIYLKNKFIPLKILKRKNFFVKRQYIRIKPRIKSRTYNRLYGSPQRKGVVKRVAIMTPKKPNSALRHVAKITVYKTSRQAICRIPGSSNLPNKYARVLARGGRANDVPTVRLTIIRGVFDFSPIFSKKKRRSIYGVYRLESQRNHIRRRFRHLY